MEDREIPALEASIERIWDLARESGLDPFPVHFEIVPASIMYEFGAYLLPGRFSHWTHGKALYPSGGSQLPGPALPAPRLRGRVRRWLRRQPAPSGCIAFVSAGSPGASAGPIGSLCSSCAGHGVCIGVNKSDTQVLKRSDGVTALVGMDDAYLHGITP